MNTLPITIGILTHKSIKALPETLKTYKKNDLLEMVDEVILFVNECVTDYESSIALEYDIKNIITKENNDGIGEAFLQIAKSANNENIMLLEDDFKLIENKNVTYRRLKVGLELLESGYKCIRYRHRERPGYPLFTYEPYNISNPLSKYDPIIEAYAPHLIDLIHWHHNLDLEYPDKIGSMIIEDEIWYDTTSEWANFTNNPCMYKKDFYINIINKFPTTGIGLEDSISKFWNRQKYLVAQGPGLYEHHDEDKYN